MKKRTYPEEGKEMASPRRSFLNKLWVFLGFVALAEVIWVILSYLKPVRKQETGGAFGGRIIAGPVGSFSPNTVTAFPRGHFYLACLKEGGFLAIHRKCTHLGCTVPWVEKEQAFICPCHSSTFDIQGAVIRSPASRALDIFPVLIENNVVFVDTGRTIKRNAFKPDQVVYNKRA
ncbi:MAG: Rieske 2Fe-2S domain-containing protein [Desulfobacterales bacterium]|nr:Rieske 2Fe-2S domain-containing protein [Desulfobacterales bacterium]MDX2513173.1 Rieske 2Fe-2S domain-containing protein [Desulfobacterales bacterium]